jgi:hypothetical protein
MPRPMNLREAVLAELCAKYGFCNELTADDITDLDSRTQVTRAVLVAEGFDPDCCEKRIRWMVESVVDDWLFDPRGRGVRSGLPR